MLILVFAVLSFLSTNVEACGGTFTASSDTLQSPGYPGNYTNNLDCIYVIRRAEGERITLTFESLDLQGACTQDFLELRDGDSPTSPFISSVCGTKLETPMRSFQNTMYIRFRTDGSETGTGFRVIYTSAVLRDNFFLIPATPGRILRMDVETTSNIVIPGLNVFNPIAVDFDPVERRVYWTDLVLRTINNAHLNGTGQKVIIGLSTGAVPDGLAVDPVTRLVFYTDAGNDIIAMMTTSGSSHRTIISTDLDQPRAIVLDTINGVMFWTDWGTPAKIERANYDGTDRRAIITGFLVAPNALALDLPNQRLYWVDAGTDWIEFSDLDGNKRTQLNVFTGTHFFGLAYYADHLYVTDWTEAGANTNVSYIHRLGIKVRTADTLGEGPFRMNDIHVYIEDAWEQGPNGCGNNNGGCNYFCIPSPGNAFKCICPDASVSCVDERTTTTITPAKFTATTTTTSPPTKVNIAGPDFFDTDGTQKMNLTCDPDNQKPVTSVLWSVACAGQQDRKCAWTPTPPVDDGKVVTCYVIYADGQSGVGSFTVRLNYPPPALPAIQGYKNGDMLQAGDSLTMTCLVRDGKPLVTSVIFSCPGYPDSVSDIRGDTEVQSILTINSLQSKDDGIRCVCTAEWKKGEFYVLSATRILSVKAVNATADTHSGLPMAIVGGAVAGGGVFILIIVVVVVVVVIRQKRNVRYEHPKRATRKPEAQGNPYDRIGQPMNQGSQVRSNPFIHDVRHFSSIYDEVGQLEETVGASADNYIHPVAPPPYCPQSTGAVPAIYDPAHPEYSLRIQTNS